MDRDDAGEAAAGIPSQRARGLFARWAAEEEAGYEGEISWEEFKAALDSERRFPEHRLFPERREVRREREGGHREGAP